MVNNILDLVKGLVLGAIICAALYGPILMEWY
jgi:hypothetical protein